ncbi:histidine kinase CKI1 [Capsicum galapagoense]
MKLCSFNILRHVFFLVLLGLAIYIFMKLSIMRNNSERHVSLLSEQLRNKTFAQIENTANMVLPLNSSASNLARYLSSSLNGTQLTFTTIQTEVAHKLFLSFSTIPFVSQISYLGQDRLMYSFYTEEGHNERQTFAVFTNSSSAVCYSQPANRDSGIPYGQPAVVDAKTVGLEILGWSKQSSNGTMGYASQSFIGIGLNKAKRKLFFNTAAMDGRAKISVGFSVQLVKNEYSNLNFYGADFYLASNNGQIIVDTKIPHTSINAYNGTISVQFKNLDGTHQDLSGNQSCKLGNGERGQFEVKIKEEKYMFYCSVIEIAGLEAVYSLAFNAQAMGRNVHKHNKEAYLLLVFMFVIVVVSLCSFIIIVFKAARRDMFLCAALIKQMELSNQAEKKSLTKSQAFATASHDIRNGFGSITCKINSCLDYAPPQLEQSLKLIHDETMNLLDILNSVLDASKIEAGKMPLKMEEFDLAELVEKLIDLHYHRAIEKGVDLILDPIDDSLAKFRLVKGDRVKIMQILSNLITNAIKFTQEGHICVKASVSKPSRNNALVVCSHHNPLNCWTRLCTKQKCCCNTSNDFPAIQQNPNCMEFTFEVDDTGCGIPKDKQKSVFENFVQVKEEPTSGEEGYGLGLGIVQSMVHLMGGEIEIVDKDDGERGTRFQFNIFLTTRDTVSVEAEEQENNVQNHGLIRSYLSHHLGMQFRLSPPRSEGCQVVLFLTGEKRRKVLSRAIDSMNIKVTEVRKINELARLLDRIKRNMDLSSNLTNDDTNEVASETKDTQDHAIPHCKRSNVLLIIIDSQAGPLSELSLSVVNFKKDLQNVTCKFVLLQDHVSPPCLPPFDCVFTKPLHGKRLHEVLRLLFENRNSPIQHDRTKTSQEIECQELKSGTLPTCQLEEIVIPDSNKKSSSKELRGKKVLVVDDQLLQRMYASKLLQKEGADVDVCENGKDAFDKVFKSLNEADKTYDFIVMDCQMPVMDGYQATRLIRKEEKRHGIHIPIIALTGDDMNSHIKDAGMDFHLTKPLKLVDLYALPLTALH